MYYENVDGFFDLQVCKCRYFDTYGILKVCNCELMLWYIKC